MVWQGQPRLAGLTDAASVSGLHYLLIDAHHSRECSPSFARMVATIYANDGHRSTVILCLLQGNTHYGSIRYFHLFLSDNQPFVSHGFHETRSPPEPLGRWLKGEKQGAKGNLKKNASLHSRLPAGCRERSDAVLCEIRAICVKINHLT